MQGLHLTADLYQCRCDPAWLNDGQRLGDWCLQAARAAGLEPIHQAFHSFALEGRQPGGASAMLLLAKSHVCLHTWPQRRGVTADIYISHLGGDRSALATQLMAALVERLQPEWTEQRSLDRGDENT